MDTTELGFNIYDIRDFFDNSFVKEYEESVIRMREYFSRKLDRCTKMLPYNDGCPSWNMDFISHMEKLVDSDFSYLQKPTYYHKETDKIWEQMDHNFVKECFEYYDKHNIDENVTNDEIPGISTISNGFYHQCVFADVESFEKVKKELKNNSVIINYLLMNDTINFKLMKLCYGSVELPIDCKSADWTEFEDKVINLDSSKRYTWLNVVEEKYFHPIHQDGTSQNRKFTCLNYPNIGRNLADGALFRYYTGDDSYHETLCNYTTVIVLNHTIDNDKVGKLNHQVTKNLGEVRYNVYNTFAA
jgi:hypothetical protein